MLGECLGAIGVVITAIKQGGWGEGQGLLWGLAFLLATTIPQAVLFAAYDKERERRLEIEKRWKRSLEKESV